MKHIPRRNGKSIFPQMIVCSKPIEIDAIIFDEEPTVTITPILKHGKGEVYTFSTCEVK